MRIGEQGVEQEEQTSPTNGRKFANIESSGIDRVKQVVQLLIADAPAALRIEQMQALVVQDNADSSEEQAQSHELPPRLVAAPPWPRAKSFAIAGIAAAKRNKICDLS